MSRSLSALPAGERLAVGGERERHGLADALREGGGEHRELAVEGERRRPAQRLQRQRRRAPLDVLAHAPARPARSGRRRRSRRPAASRASTGCHSHGAGSDDQRALGGEVGVRAAQVVVEDRRDSSPRLPVDQPAVGGAGGLHHRLRQRRVAVDDARDLGIAALERAHVDELLDQLGRLRRRRCGRRAARRSSCSPTILTSPVRSP